MVASGRSQLTISKVQRPTNPNAQSGQMVDNQPKGNFHSIFCSSNRYLLFFINFNLILLYICAGSVVHQMPRPLPPLQQAMVQVPMKSTLQATSSNGQATQSPPKNVAQPSSSSAAVAPCLQGRKTNNESVVDIDETCI